ncbi:MAG: UpxY family transcription antiterminator [Bacteroidales bacterium]|jgi:transcription antitermination factor NusG|nr:UpxY family transcription antiterminator [Bacteroidales bacterium]
MKSVKKPSQWRVLYTKPRSEKRAYEALIGKGYTAYLPCTTVIRQWSDRKKKVLEPLFKSYVFVLCRENQIGIAANDDTIVSVVRFEGRPAIVREKEMEMIRKIEAGIEEDEAEVVNQPFISGEKVRVMGGKLKGISGVLTEFRGSHRVAVSIDSLGCNIIIEVPSKYLGRESRPR